MKYCKDLFKESPRLRKKCEQDFCNFCCEKNVPWIHKTHLFSCKKQCWSFSNSTNKKSGSTWKDLCINIARPNFSIYAYCDDHFSGEVAKSTCKLDTCRLCCVTTDEVRHKNLKIRNLFKCFQECGKKYTYRQKSELEQSGLSPAKLSKKEENFGKKKWCYIDKQ